MRGLSGNSLGKILFTFWDGGFGHINRLIPIVREFSTSDYKVGFICSKKFHPYLNRVQYIDEVFIIENRKIQIHKPSYRFPIYSHAFRHAQRLKGLEFDDIEFLELIVKQELNVISEFKPDVIINDYRDTIKISAEIAGIPVVGITTSNGNTVGYTLGWWIDPPDDLTLPDCRDSFNIVRSKHKLSPMIDERESFEGDICIIPSSPSIDPLISKRDKDHYVGVLHKVSSVSKPPKKFAYFFNPKDYLIFWYLGEGNNRPYVDFDSILCDFIDKINAYIVVAGPIERYPKLSAKSSIFERILVKEFFEEEEYSWILKNASLIVNQGGSTAMLGLAMGIPIIAIPWNSEPNMAIFASRYGAGIHLPHSNEPLERREAPDLGKNVEIMGHWHSELNIHRMRDAIETILNDSSHKKRASELSVELEKLGGVKKIVQLITSSFL